MMVLILLGLRPRPTAPTTDSFSAVAWSALLSVSHEGEDGTLWSKSIRIAVATFGAEGALERTVRLPFGEFPGVVLLGLAATEQFTHGWDLARAIGHPANLDPALAARLLGQARLAVSDAFRGPDGQALFGPAVAVPDSAGPADRLAGFLGRSV
jgi:uncharacterized protein (TIGR03086 family)